MTKTTFKGFEVICLEHIDEIKKTSNGSLFKKYYNKKQMFNDLLGKKYIKYDGGEIVDRKITKEDFGFYGKLQGQKAVAGKYGDYQIEIYKVEDVEKEKREYIIKYIARQLTQITSSYFLVKADDGQVYLFFTDID